MPWQFQGNKRPNYFTGQLLDEEDFQAEQAYHLIGSRRHAQGLHTWGIIAGLELSTREDGCLVLRPGSAIDSAGRLITVPDSEALEAPAPAGEGSVYLSLGYEEAYEESAVSTDNAQNYTRIAEMAAVVASLQPPPNDGSVVPLGRAAYSQGRFGAIDATLRKIAGARLAPQSVVTADLANGSVTAPKLSPEIRVGWVRLPFKPSTFVEPLEARTAVPISFSIGVTNTYCDSRGAKGTMSIPVPMAATRIKTFLFAGARNDGQIEIELQKCGWDLKNNAHVKVLLTKQTIAKKSPFYERWDVNQPLDPIHGALAIYVHAEGEAHISLVAAEFEW